jgi:hypothetical protein
MMSCNGKFARFLWLLAALCGFFPGYSIAAQDTFRQLDAKEIRARLVGRDITDSSHWSMYLRPDGALIGTESNTRWTGTWRLQQNKLCMSNPETKSLECYEIWMSGEKISFRIKPGDDTFVAFVELHKGK